ncbi:MAG: DUF1080 domain-containing protein [candidate division KSB1 bacterium]|nr:DUF1080 domain-containing protein [candidate division KSB1 bacterium]MDZ7365672.1 DUF1080 domain-containing protein [candidate division KSB1 bacterium]MDZ7403252.1 DUF1080 domain-containing protein [candidate division KSB1 bacterium]
MRRSCTWILNDHNFKNFELMAEVKTTPGSNSGELMVDYTAPENSQRRLHQTRQSRGRQVHLRH